MANIGSHGSGRVASALAGAFARADHAVTIGSRDPAAAAEKWSGRRRLAGRALRPEQEPRRTAPTRIAAYARSETLNTAVFTVMVDPRILATPPTVCLSGDDDDAKQAVLGLLTELGWPAEWIIDLGDITSARGPEGVALLRWDFFRHYRLDQPIAVTIAR